MNHNKIIALSLILLFSNFTYTSTPRTCLQRSYRELKKLIIYTTIGTYIHQNIMTKQDLTQMPELSADDITEYKNKLGTTLQNGCRSLDNSYISLKKLTLDMDPNDELQSKYSLLPTNWKEIYSHSSVNTETLSDDPKIDVTANILCVQDQETPDYNSNDKDKM